MNDIDFNIIMELDLEKYLNNGPLQIKAIRGAKKRVLNDRMKFQQKTIANYRSVIARFNSPDCAFKFPIDQNKDNFPVWRNTVFQNLQNVFAIQKKTSIHSLENLKQVELKNIILALNLSPTDQAYAYVLENQPIDNYVALASLCGLIDHAKAVYYEGRNKLVMSLKEIILQQKYGIAMDALRKVQNPVISSENSFLLGARQKGAIAAWVCVLKFRNYIDSHISNKDLAKAINQEITGLDLYKDGGTLDDNKTSAFLRYYNKFLVLIP